MSNSQLSNYVRQQLQQGKNKDEIKGELLGAGWQEADIDQTLSMSGLTPPKPPAPTPSFAPTGQQHLNPKAVWLFFFHLIFTFSSIVILLGFLIISGLSDTILRLLATIPAPPETILFGVLGIGLAMILAVVVFSFIWAKLEYRFYRFELTEEGFRKEFGVISKKYATIPYDRIQNVDIYRGILARILGLSDLSIQTAGSTGITSGEGKLPGLSMEDAEQIRNEIIHRARQTRNQGI